MHGMADAFVGMDPREGAHLMDGEDKGEKRGLHRDCMPLVARFRLGRTVGVSNRPTLVAEPGCRLAGLQKLVELGRSWLLVVAGRNLNGAPMVVGPDYSLTGAGLGSGLAEVRCD